MADGRGHELISAVLSSEVDGVRIMLVSLNDRSNLRAGYRAAAFAADARQAAVLTEFAGHPVPAVQLTLNAAVGAGLAEIKGFWTRRDDPRRRALAASVVDIGRRLGARYLFCTSVAHASKRWLAAVTTRLESVPGVPFPDTPYRTVVPSWDLTGRVAR